MTYWRPVNQNWSGFANKIAKIIDIWIKRSVKQVLKGKSTFKTNIYRTVAFTQVLQNLFDDRGLGKTSAANLFKPAQVTLRFTF